uniref:Glutamate rich 1 n=1 Tax=Lepisosteus oculatus TaxID=7918 RepID=W5NKZ5_LEPOC|nr:PREDICTED: glutamate-rich protein 1 [Lepisosteus oculatus]
MPNKRKEVFQEKVLQRLYQCSPKTKNVQNAGLGSPPGPVDEKSLVKLKANSNIIKGAEEKKPLLQRRLYTVCPPPDEFKTGGERSVAPCEPEDINSERNSAEDAPQTSTGRRPRRRKRKTGNPSSGVAGEERAEHAATPTPEPENPPESPHQEERDASLSRNRKRKLKKRRRKEELRSLGLIPRTAAVEFTYRPEEGGILGQEEEEELSGRQAADVLDFLQATQEIYFTDRTAAASRTAVPQSFLKSLATGAVPAAQVALLYQLKSLVLLQDIERLKRALEEFQHNSVMPPGETSALCSLFKYWITDILPVRKQELK